MENIKKYHKIVINGLKNIFSGYKPEEMSLYAPVYYALEGGKKIRPVSVLLTTDVFGGNLKHAVSPAFAVEMFHNFTLLHDDVMDNSPVRRKRQTVHAKWDANQAILSGDAMFALVYRNLLLLPKDKLQPVMKIITDTALQVCEGQQLDMQFENRFDVTLAEYLKMIKLKTAVLLACSLALGAIIADASEQNIQQIYKFGINLGLAFQIQDDYFDTFADFDVFGKKIGNDIVTNKKTFLLIKAIEVANEEQKNCLSEISEMSNFDEQEKIKIVKDIYLDLNINEISKEHINLFYKKAIRNIDNITDIDSDKKDLLYKFAEYIIKRKK